jgi:hypothetical protein
MEGLNGDPTCKVCMTTTRLQHYQFQCFFNVNNMHPAGYCNSLLTEYLQLLMSQPFLLFWVWGGLGFRVLDGLFCLPSLDYVHFECARVNQHLPILEALSELSLSLLVQLCRWTLHCKFGWRKVKAWRMGSAEWF